VRNYDIKTAWKSKSHEKTKSVEGKEDTTDRGHHHGGPVVSSASTFFCSFYLPWAQQFRDICGETHSTKIKTKAKRSKIL